MPRSPTVRYPDDRSAPGGHPTGEARDEGHLSDQTTDSGGGLVLAVLAAAVLAGSGAASAIASAVVTILIIAAVVTALAVAGGIACLMMRARSGRPGQPLAA